MASQQAAPSGSAYRPPKPQRILACVLCQQRKVKCDRKFPCNHCIKSNLRCVPAQQMPRRRRKPTEHDLAERLRQCEELLRKHNITVESSEDLDAGDSSLEDGAQSSAQTLLDGVTKTSVSGIENVKSEDVEVKNFWDAMHQRPPNGTRHDTGKSDTDNNFGQASFDDLAEPTIVKMWGRVYDSDHNHLFGSAKVDEPLSDQHPSHVHIFRLWQIYLDNVNPLLKVTHAPTLQARILDAAVDVSSISHELEALMFSIYSSAIITINDEDCQTMFGELKSKLLRKYQDACHQALIKCGFLRSRERDCLTAFFLYLVSLRPDTHPHTLSPMFAIAFRIAHRMSISSETSNAKHGIFEAEMRRRLWWAMVVYDSRISEMTDYKTTQLIPTWDCKVPANVNDFDLRPEMTTRPVDQDASTEASFAVVRGVIGNFIRHNILHLDFINPLLKHVVKATQHTTEPYDDNLTSLEEKIETQHLAHCTLENPLHYMITWWARNYLAKYRFFLHCSKYAQPLKTQTTVQRDAILSHALRMLECDTALSSSPLTKSYRWLIQFHFPFPAYVRIVQDLRLRPVGAHAERAWETVCVNYGVRFVDMEPSANHLFRLFASSVLQAWDVRRAAVQGEGGLGDGPAQMVADIRRKLGQSVAPVLEVGEAVSPAQGYTGMMTPEDIQAPTGGGEYQNMYFQDPSLAALNADVFEMDWSNIDWTLMAGLS